MGSLMTLKFNDEGSLELSNYEGEQEDNPLMKKLEEVRVSSEEDEDKIIVTPSSKFPDSQRTTPLREAKMDLVDRTDRAERIDVRRTNTYSKYNQNERKKIKLGHTSQAYAYLSLPNNYKALLTMFKNIDDTLIFFKHRNKTPTIREISKSIEATHQK
jgi:hypothetical protein